MSNPNALILKALGLNTQPNEMTVPEGSLSVGENVEISRDGVVQIATGFEDFSGNLPDFEVQQLFAFGGIMYAIADDGWWYYDTTSSTWLRKRGAFGATVTTPYAAVYLNGHLYVVAITACVFDYNLSTGTRTVLAGRYGATGSTDGTGDAARFTAPQGITTDGTDLFVSDTNNSTIRRIVISTKVVTTIAGTAGAPGTADGTGAVARFSGARGITHLGGNLYVADLTNSTIRKVAAPLTAGAAVVTTIAGTAGASGSADGTGAVARFLNHVGMATDGTNLYCCDNGNSTIRKIAPPLTAGAAVVTTIAGTVGSAGFADGTGAAATFTTPQGIVFDGTNLYVTCVNSGNVRKLAPPLTAGAAVVTTPFGSTGGSGTADGIGSAATFSTPIAIAFDGTNLYVCDSSSNALRKIYVGTRYVTTVDGAPGVAGVTAGVPLANGVVIGPT